MSINDHFQIGLMRHPPVQVPAGMCYGHSDIPLRNGWEQYVSIPEGFAIDQIYTSPLSRCLKLARAIALQYQIPYQEDRRLIELNFGLWEGKKWDEIPKEFIDAWAENPWDWQIPEGETGRLLLARVIEIWHEIKKKGQNILIVSHGGPLRLLRQIVLEKSIELLGPLPDFGRIELFTFSKHALDKQQIACNE